MTRQSCECAKARRPRARNASVTPPIQQAGRNKARYAGLGQPSVIRVFAAWPREWEAEFTLLCRGGFLVTAALRKREIEFVEVESRLGGECRIRNPWGEGELALFRDAQKAETRRGALLKFSTRKGERMVLVRPSTTPEQFRRVVAGSNSR